MKDIFLKLMVNILKKYILTFLPKRMKIEKVEKLVANLRDKTEYVIHMRNLQQALNHGLLLKIVHKIINLIKMLG